MIGIFLVQKHSETTIWHRAWGLMVRPRVRIGHWLYYGEPGSCKYPRKYSLCFNTHEYDLSLQQERAAKA